MVRLVRYLGALFAALLLGACQALTGPEVPMPFPDSLQARALALEARGETAAAIRYWEAAAAVATEKMAALQALQGERIETELRAAEKASGEGDVDRQISHLLKVLRVEPSHVQAKEQLRGTLSRRLVVPYTVHGEESSDTIAGRVYKNVRLAPLVEVFRERDVRDGEVLWLPSVEASLVAAQFSYSKALVKARRHYEAGAWEELLAAAEEILNYAPDDDETLFLKNTAAHNLAEVLFQKGSYREALKMYRRVDAYFKNEKPRIEEILSIQRRLSDEARAHENASMLKEAMRLEQRGALLEAHKVLVSVDSGFPGRVALEQRLTKKMNRKAESHYRAGVQLFLEENLTGAIAEWEKCLALNPRHVKSREGVENASRLLEKVKSIEPEKGGRKP